MNNQNNEFTVLKMHEEPIESSVTGKMTMLHQLCQNNVSKEHFLTYEVLDADRGILGGRLFYEFKTPNQALDEWEAFIGDGLDSNAKFTITKQEFPPGKRSRFN